MICYFDVCNLHPVNVAIETNNLMKLMKIPQYKLNIHHSCEAIAFL